MSRIIMLIPFGNDVGLTSVSMGILHATQRRAPDTIVSYSKPIEDLDQNHHTNDLINTESKVTIAPSIARDTAMAYIGKGDYSLLLENVISNLKSVSSESEITLVEGLSPMQDYPFTNQLNAKLAQTLSAEIVLVISDDISAEQMNVKIETAYATLGGKKNKQISGVILNKLRDSLQPFALPSSVPVLSAIPWNKDLEANRVYDIMNHLNAEPLNEGESKVRRAKNIIICEHTIPYMIEHFRPGALLIISSDRTDMIVAACMASMNGIKLAGLIITSRHSIPMTLLGLCKKAFESDLPIYSTSESNWSISKKLHEFNPCLQANDKRGLFTVRDYIASNISNAWINSLTTNEHREKRLSPPAFRYELTELARNADKRIVLPEGNELRTIKAAAICAKHQIAKCVLLGNPNEIKHIVKEQGVVMGEGVTIIDADAIRESYVARLVQLRSSKGMTEATAREKLSDNVYLGTMMLENNEVDGLVSGAVHTTANTVVPPLQIIKTAPEASIVSSVFFMLLPDQVLVYADCAINPNPSAEELADIAIQSADSALAFGIEPRVAMISYSTGSSGKGDDVEKVREATRLAKAKRPELLIDGPMQYDAAVVPDVAASKAPDSPVAGKATVFVFPDLNTGNTTYKAVQRSADLVSIGPMLQGMRKPVNDLSRGALVDDIVYTVALTAIQAEQTENA